MKKIIVIAAIAATSFSASATKNDNYFISKWRMNDNMIPTVSSVDMSYGAIFVGSNVDFIGASCLPSDDESQSVKIINGTPVKMDAYCFQGYYRYYASTQEGAIYVINEFRNKNYVTAFDTRFTAAGFKEASAEYFKVRQKAL